MQRVIGIGRTYQYELYIIIIGICAGVSQYYFLRDDNSFYWSAMLTQVKQGLQLYNYFHAHSFLAFIKEVYSPYYFEYYSPLLPLLYFLYYLIFSPDPNMGMMVNAGFVMVGLFGIYKSGALLFSKHIGFSAALTWSVLPSVLFERCSTWYEFPLMCVAPWMLFCLVKSDSFRSLRWSIAFGVVFAAMLAIKGEGIIFGLIPLGHVAMVFVKGTKFGGSLRNAFIAACAGVILVLHGMVINYKALISYLQWHQVNDGKWHFVWKWAFYENYLQGGYLMPRWGWEAFLAVAAFVSILICFRKLRSQEVKRIAYLSIYAFIPLVFFGAFSITHKVHIFVAIPFVVLALCGGLSLIRIRCVRHCVVILLIIYGFGGHYAALCSPLQRGQLEQAILRVSSEHLNFQKIYGELPKPLLINFRQAYETAFSAIMNDMTVSHRRRDASGKSQNFKVLGNLDDHLYSVDPLRMSALANNVPAEIVRLDWEEKLQYDLYDYIVAQEEVPFTNDYMRIAAADIKNKDSILWDSFTPLAEAALNNGNKIIVMKRRI
jgi:hypothetical protein